VKALRVGLLGCGRIAQRYVEVFRDEVKGAVVTAVCDRVTERADRRAGELGARAVYDLADLLGAADVDVVAILTESGRHAEHAEQVLGAGKHAIVEKPPAMFPHQVVRCERIAAEARLMYAVILQNRFNPAMRALRAAHEARRFGRPVLATVRLRWCRFQDYYEDGWHGTWRLDGGVLSQQAIHHLDALQWICGPVEEVVCAQANALNRLEAEDTAVATLRFRNGFLGAIEATTAARPEDLEASISVLGETGFAVVGGIALNEVQAWRFQQPRPEDETASVMFSQKVPTGYGLSHGPLLQEIVDRIRAGRLDPPIRGEDSLDALRLIHALYASAERGGWVKVNDQTSSTRLGR
jgi:predicted dehydrogenase